MKMLTVGDIVELIGKLGVAPFLARVVDTLEGDFRRWQSFRLSPRSAVAYPQGVMELMPCADDHHYAFKFINGHPGNTARGDLSVCGLGLWAGVETGYPLMITEMTLLTACRTAATAALASRYLARPDSRTMALVGTGAQGEFLCHALTGGLPIERVRYYDHSDKAMAKFRRNMAPSNIQLIPCADLEDTLAEADLVVTATAARRHAGLMGSGQLQRGCHYIGVGGDAPGKTEFTPEALALCKIVVEYLPQTRVEGEIQQLPDGDVHGELWEVVTGRKPGRESDDEITLFDSVGFALEDFSILSLVYDLSQQFGLGREVDLIPRPRHPGDLFGLLV